MKTEIYVDVSNDGGYICFAGHRNKLSQNVYGGVVGYRRYMFVVDLPMPVHLEPTTIEASRPVEQIASELPE